MEKIDGEREGVRYEGGREVAPGRGAVRGKEGTGKGKAGREGKRKRGGDVRSSRGGDVSPNSDSSLYMLALMLILLTESKTLN